MKTMKKQSIKCHFKRKALGEDGPDFKFQVEITLDDPATPHEFALLDEIDDLSRQISRKLIELKLLWGVLK